MKKLTCLIMIIALLVSNTSYGLNVSPGVESPITRGNMQKMARVMWAEKNTPGEIGVLAKELSEKIENKEFSGYVPRIDNIGQIHSALLENDPGFSMRNGMTTDPEEAIRDYCKFNTYFAEALATGTFSILTRNYGYAAADGEIPLCRLEGTGPDNCRLVMHNDFNDRLKDIQKKNIRFDYNFDDDETKEVNIAEGLLDRVKRHYVRDTEKDYKGYLKKGGHLVSTKKKLSDERNANDINGRFSFINDAIFLWFLGSYCFEDSTRYNNDLLKNRLYMFYANKEKFDFKNQFPNLNDDNIDAAIDLALYINHCYFGRRHSSGEAVSVSAPKQESHTAEDEKDVNVLAYMGEKSETDTYTYEIKSSTEKERIDEYLDILKKHMCVFNEHFNFSYKETDDEWLKNNIKENKNDWKWFLKKIVYGIEAANVSTHYHQGDVTSAIHIELKQETNGIKKMIVTEKIYEKPDKTIDTPPKQTSFQIILKQTEIPFSKKLVQQLKKEFSMEENPEPRTFNLEIKSCTEEERIEEYMDMFKKCAFFSYGYFDFLDELPAKDTWEETRVEKHKEEWKVFIQKMIYGIEGEYATLHIYRGRLSTLHLKIEKTTDGIKMIATEKLYRNKYEDKNELSSEDIFQILLKQKEIPYSDGYKQQKRKESLIKILKSKGYKIKSYKVNAPEEWKTFIEKTVALKYASFSFAREDNTSMFSGNPYMTEASIHAEMKDITKIEFSGNHTVVYPNLNSSDSPHKHYDQLAIVKLAENNIDFIDVAEHRFQDLKTFVTTGLKKYTQHDFNISENDLTEKMTSSNMSIGETLLLKFFNIPWEAGSPSYTGRTELYATRLSEDNYALRFMVTSKKTNEVFPEITIKMEDENVKVLTVFDIISEQLLDPYRNAFDTHPIRELTENEEIGINFALQAVEKENIEIYIPFHETFAVRSLINTMNQKLLSKGASISVERYKTQTGLKKLLKKNSQKSNIKRIIIADKEKAQDINSMVNTDGNIDLFRNVRLLVMDIPDLSEIRKKEALEIETLQQAEMIIIAILSRLINETNSSQNISIKALLETMIEKYLENKSILSAFIDELSTEEDQTVPLADIKSRILAFLDASRRLNLRMNIEWNLRVTEHFGTFA